MNTHAQPIASDGELEALGIRRIPHFQNSRVALSPKARLEAVRQAALDFRRDMLEQDTPVRFYRSIDLIRVPYPTKYGLLNVDTAITPYLHILNRLFVLQFDSPTGLKTLLFSPSDIDANGETPFFKDLRGNLGWLEKPMMNFLSPQSHDVPQALAKLGLKPEDIDYISYDHLHTQDLRRWLGNGEQLGYFPNAKLLVMDQEWRSTLALLPPQQTWYCPDGLLGIPEEKVIRLNGSVMLGDGVALVQTPGHTEGNHSLVAHTDDGLLVTSENGICAECYAPEHSTLKGVKAFAERTGMEVVLNGNTLEGALDQYISMVLEKTIAGPSPQNPDFPNVAPSSELTAYWGFPGLKPRFSVGERQYGQLQQPE